MLIVDEDGKKMAVSLTAGQKTAPISIS